VANAQEQTIVPLLSQTKPKIKLDDQMVRSLTTRIQCAGDEIIQTKAGLGSATLCMVYAAYRSTTLTMDLISRFAELVIQASMGAKGIVEPSFVELTEILADYRLTVCNVPIRLGRSALMNRAC
jgi:malate/lactate dehydrogenase